VVRRLLRHGCDVDARSERNRTALHMAVWNNRPRIVRLLLGTHCSLNVRDRYGDTPLMLSARRGYPDVMRVCPHLYYNTLNMFYLLIIKIVPEVQDRQIQKHST